MRLIDADALMEGITTWQKDLEKEYGWHDAYVQCLDGVISSIESASTVNPWHRVEDELPPPNKTVLVCKIWRDVNGEPHKVITMDSFTISPSDSVIAWMPLPEPPKEDA